MIKNILSYDSILDKVRSRMQGDLEILYTFTVPECKYKDDFTWVDETDWKLFYNDLEKFYTISLLENEIDAIVTVDDLVKLIKSKVRK